MELLTGAEETRHFVQEARRRGLLVGFVPTMGYLHDGHVALIRRAREETDLVCVSIFVNPTQFGPAEDFDRYPRDLERDSAICREAGVDLIFHPSVEEMYPSGASTFVQVEGPLTERLEGAARPGHFRGVATVVAKLFHIIPAHRAYFGEKDYQQLQIIRKMVRDLQFGVEIVPVPTVREPDGLAMSSRNVYLSDEERRQATVLYRSLVLARDMAARGVRDAAQIRREMESKILSEPLAKIDYVSISHPETLEELEEIKEAAIALLAVRFGATRLIDNMRITPGSE